MDAQFKCAVDSFCHRQSGKNVLSIPVVGFLLFGMVAALLLLIWPVYSLVEGPTDLNGAVTNVRLVRFVIEPKDEKRDASLVAILKNESVFEATSVLMSFTELPSEVPPQKATRIESQAEVSLSLISVPDFLRAFASKCPGCYFLGVGNSVQMPHELVASLCKRELSHGKNCAMQYSVYPVSVEKSFVNVRQESVSNVGLVYVYLSPTFKTDHVLMRSSGR